MKYSERGKEGGQGLKREGSEEMNEEKKDGWGYGQRETDPEEERKK